MTVEVTRHIEGLAWNSQMSPVHSIGQQPRLKGWRNSLDPLMEAVVVTLRRGAWRGMGGATEALFADVLPHCVWTGRVIIR